MRFLLIDMARLDGAINSIPLHRLKGIRYTAMEDLSALRCAGH
jgi:hypothetical protein